MVPNFLKLKKRARDKAFLLSGLLSGSAGLLTFGILLLVFKLTGREFPWYGYALCSLGALALVGGVVLLSSYPRTKRFARKLDKKYGLEEKVQTMVEYAEREGAVLELQREATESALALLPKPKKSFFTVFRAVVLPALAVITCSVSLALPKKSVPAEPSLPPKTEEEVRVPYDATEAIKMLNALIANVKIAKWEDETTSTWKELQPAYEASLEALLEFLQKGTATEDEVRVLVLSTMDIVVSLATETNSYNAYVSAALEKESLRSFAKALYDSGRAYKIDGNPLDFVSLQNKANALYERASAYLGQYAGSFDAEIEPFDKTEYVAYMTDYVADLDEILQKSEKENDPLTEAIKILRDKFAQTLTDINEGFGLAVKDHAVSAIEQLEYRIAPQSAASPLSGQAYSYSMRDYVLYGLDHIFGWGIPYEEELFRDKNEEVGGEGGSTGEGSLIFPSNGSVLDKEQHILVEYGKVLGDYDDLMKETLKDNDTISDEMKQAIENYFKSLWSSKDE